MAIDWLKYANQSATRRLPVSEQLVNALSFLPKMGLTMEVFSGGQPATGLARVGSTRHDHGNAADVFFYRNGQRLDWSNPNDLPVFQEIVRRSRAAGVTGFGAGPGYMQPGSMHIGFGAPGVWGAGGKSANAPEWLRAAFQGAPAGSPPAPLGSMYAKAPTPAPTAAPRPALGAPVPPTAPGMAVASASAPTPPVPLGPGQVLGGLATLFMQDQQRRQERREEEEAAERARRLALFGGPIYG
jgi:hypothetical protein